MTGPCPDCFRGTITKEIPNGKETVLHGLPTYVAESEGDSKGIIVFISDAFGWKMPNNRVLADRYAEKGSYTVYLPDFMNGINISVLSHVSESMLTLMLGNAASPTMMALMHHAMAPASTITNIFVIPFLVARILFYPLLCAQSPICEYASGSQLCSSSADGAGKCQCKYSKIT